MIGKTGWTASGSSDAGHEIEREALATVLLLLRSKLPTAGGRGRGSRDGRALNGELACQRLAERAAIKGVACPGCGCFSTGYKYVQVGKVFRGGVAVALGLLQLWPGVRSQGQCGRL